MAGKGKQSDYEITFFSRGGQGGITSCQLLAQTAFIEGFKDVMSIPQIGAERRGAAIRAFLIISKKEIRKICAVTNPDIVMILDESLMNLPAIVNAIPKKNCKVIVNAENLKGDTRLSRDIELYSFPGTSIALKLNLMLEGSPLVNVPILGAFSKATGLVSKNSLYTVLKDKWGSRAARNIKAIELSYDKIVRVN
ncbi:MAG: 2-oxoacid:acceptor oxidoreductase family protein [Deltaproteobacteria bacterium]|nr:2-oxoacid:acceptor oxidoreductase family protein [Deltaproteobacteria bacterium]MBW2218410.1 2-oxoacid:acceptor oxidoreductase family protein [Deltaproteobacteria bacterium]